MIDAIDRDTARDFGAANPSPAVNAEYERMCNEIQRLADKIAYLTRDRDRWRERAGISDASARDAAEALFRIKEKCNALRARAGGAE